MRRHNKDFFFFVKEERKRYEKMKRKMKERPLPSKIQKVPYGFRKVCWCKIQVSNCPKNTLPGLYVYAKAPKVGGILKVRDKVVAESGSIYWECPGT
jgi:hypothetical protein